MNDTEKALREAVRLALNNYLSYVKIKLSTGKEADTDEVDLLVTRTELMSAKRVLWMED